MNGIEALYKCMQDPELEFQRAGFKRWYTFKEYLDSFINTSIEISFLQSDGLEVRKRQSNLDKAVEEVCELLVDVLCTDKTAIQRPSTSSRIKEILKKYIKEES